MGVTVGPGVGGIGVSVGLVVAVGLDGIGVTVGGSEVAVGVGALAPVGPQAADATRSKATAKDGNAIAFYEWPMFYPFLECNGITAN
jgi:hypothetical protein